MSGNFCNKCGDCCRRIPVDFEKRIIFFDGVQILTNEFEQMLYPVSKTKNITFCSCKYLENNLCVNSNKPKECANYPSSPFAYIPENCGFYGEIFSKSERFKQYIRKLKEEIIYCESLHSSDRNVQMTVEHNKSVIDKYKIYGSEDW